MTGNPWRAATDPFTTPAGDPRVDDPSADRTGTRLGPDRRTRPDASSSGHPLGAASSPTAGSQGAGALLGPTGPQQPADFAPRDGARSAAAAAGKAAGGSAGRGATSSAAGAAGQTAAGVNPASRVGNAAQELRDAQAQGGAGATAQKAGAIAGREALRAADTYFTAGALQKIPGVSQGLDFVGEKLGGTAVKVAAVGIQVLLGALLLGTVALIGNVFMDSGPNLSGGADAPDQDQCNSMPEGWCDITYDAQLQSARGGFATPWTVLAGLAKVQTDYARTSPYDTVDRFPDRPIPSYLAANFAASAVGPGGPVGGTTNTSGSKAWGGFANGEIPSSKLCSTFSGETLACEAATAMEKLNTAFKADFGHDICFNDGYRSIGGQRAMLARYGTPRAAVPGTSNHGWGKAVDICQGGGSSGAALTYSSKEYTWLKAHADAYGWYHPSYMEPNGRGPHEPWHWEYGGLSASPGSALIAPAAAKSLSSCQVQAPSVAIGGQGSQAAGPFLLNPAAVAQMTAQGLDPQDACDSAQFVASALAEVGLDKLDGDDLPDSDDDSAAAAKWWQDVIAAAGIFSDPSTASGSCVVASGDPESYPVSALIDETWRCMLAQAADLHVVQSASTDATGKVTFSEYDRGDAAAVLLAEARQVAWSGSQFGERSCSEDAKYAGVFPMTKKQASSVGAVSRCDAQDNIRAAAELVLKGEAVPVAKRSTKQGPYQPMIGGWASFAAALGQDADLLPKLGPQVEWEMTSACQALVDPFVKALAADSSGLAIYGDRDTKVTATTLATHLADAPKLAAQRDKLLAAPECAGATAADVYAAGARLADAYVTSVPGLAPARPGSTGEMDTTAASATTPAPTPSASAAPDWDPVSMLGASRVLAAAGQEPASTTAKWGRDSVLERLSTSAHLVEPAPASDGATETEATPWMVQATEWATFFGGLFPGQDSFGTRIGSLEGSLSGDGTIVAGTGSASVQAQTVIAAAKAYLGTPYSWGGGGPAGPSKGVDSGAGVVGFDCSGLTEYAFAKAGYKIGSSTGPQSKQGTAVASLADAQPGDLLFFGSPIHHVAIYLGNNQLIHAPKPGDVVKIAKVYETPSTIRRVIKETAVSGGLDQWIATALGVLYTNGFPKGQDDVAALKLIIDHESSGDPKAVNTWDSNARAGHPSFGLMQTIPSTFKAYALPGYTDKADPVAQIIAGARYSQKRYGGLDEVPGVKAVREGRAYVGY